MKRLTLQIRRKEPARRSVLTNAQARRAAQAEEEPSEMQPLGSATAHMNFDQIYEHFAQGGSTSYAGDPNIEYGHRYYCTGGSSSQEPQVGP